jgi:hypothetical protein
MADLETSLRNLTLQNPAVATAFGNRFYWNHVPDGITYPCIKAQTITDVSGDTHSSTWGGKSLVQLDVYDDDKSGCNTGAALVRYWLNRYNGGMGTNNVTIKVRNSTSLFDVDARLYRRMMEVEILYIG